MAHENWFAKEKQDARDREFNSANDATFKNLIASETWNSVYAEECVNKKYEKFSETYDKLYDQAYPLRKKGPRRKNQRKNPKPWILPWLEDACARKNKLYYDKIKIPSALNIVAYKKLDRFCKKHVSIAKSNYYKKFFEEHQYNLKNNGR